MKDESAFSSTPHDEWFCTRLAEAVGIACPQTAVLVDGGGARLFGSRWEGGVAKDPWWDMAVRGDLDMSIVGPVLSRIFAFDCFIHNNDRHLNNYLARQTRNGWSLLAMDFSRSWLANGFPLPKLPFSPGDNTIVALRDLLHLLGDFLSLTAVNELLDRLLDVNVAKVDSIIASHPNEWLSTAQRNAISKWWKSRAREQRIQDIRKGIANGTYL